MDLRVPRLDEPQHVLEDEPQVVPEYEPEIVEPEVVDPEDEPQVVPEYEPEIVEPEVVDPEDEPQVVPENEPEVVEPEDEPQILDPEDEPQVVPEYGPQVVEPEDEPIVVEPEDEPIVVEPEDEPQVVEPEDEPQVVPHNGPLVIELEDEPEDEPENGPQVVLDEPIVVEPDDEPQVDPQEEPPPGVSEDEPHTESDWVELSEDDRDQLFKKAKVKKQDMDMMVMDFFISQELPVVAEAFHKESGCPIGLDSEDFSHVGTQKIVRDLIINRQFDEAIQTLNETMTPVFLINHPRVHFSLQQQKMVELCRRRDFNAALTFSHKFVKWESFVCRNDSFKKDCRLTLLLMLYGDDEESPASELLDYSRIYWIARYVIDGMIKYQGNQRGNCIQKALEMLVWEQYELYDLKVSFPYFDYERGFPIRKVAEKEIDMD